MVSAIASAEWGRRAALRLTSWIAPERMMRRAEPSKLHSRRQTGSSRVFLRRLGAVSVGTGIHREHFDFCFGFWSWFLAIAFPGKGR